MLFRSHLEPTFDWTLRDPQKNQAVTQVLQKELYDNIYQTFERRLASRCGTFTSRRAPSTVPGKGGQGINENVPGMGNWALYRQLVAMDRQTLVILGDPTVSLPLCQ